LNKLKRERAGHSSPFSGKGVTSKKGINSRNYTLQIEPLIRIVRFSSKTSQG